MTSDAADRTPSGHEADAPDDAPSEVAREHAAGAQRECFGPLALLRTRKADGRALLLFSHRPEQGEQ